MKTEYTAITLLSVLLMFSIMFNILCIGSMDDQHDNQTYLQDQLDKCTDVEW